MEFTGEFWLFYVVYTIVLVLTGLLFYAKIKRNIFLSLIMQCVACIFIALLIILYSVL